jgi:hypothetical protein
MGVLDDAIREHLELKRRHGAEEAEVRRQEDEALGPARREVAPAETDEAPAEAQAAADAPQGEQETLPEAHAEEAPSAAEHPAEATDLSPAEPPETGVEDAPVAAAPLDEGPALEETAVHDAQDGQSPAAHEAPPWLDEPAAEADPAEREDTAREDEPGFREQTPLDDGRALRDADLDDDELGDDTALYEVESEFDDDDEASADPFDEDDSHVAGTRSGDTPARGFAAVDEDDLEDVDDGDSDDGDPDDGDVLEDTPDFLQETPEHDRLWFEQKPPRDFDFD